MAIVLNSVAFAIAALCAGLMGYAIQRGATCTVAAVDEIVTQRSFRRLASLVEAALGIAGGLLIARALHVAPALPAGYAVTLWTVVGSVLLGLGAYINGACVIGAVARLGSGEWAYAATPIGFYLGCISVAAVFGKPAPQALGQDPPLLQASAWIALFFAAFIAWRVATTWWGRTRPATGPPRRNEALAAHVWSAHAATQVIALTFVALLLLVGAWSYTDVLAELARGMAGNLVARALLLLALLLGAMLGGWTSGRLRRVRLSRRKLLLCAAGGVLMGWGSLLLPGGNDGLVLLGMPLAWPYAWLAFATMCATIAAAQLLHRRLA